MLYAQTFKPIKQIFYFIETMRGINRQPKKVIRVSQIEFVESESDDEDVSLIYSSSSLLDFFWIIWFRSVFLTELFLSKFFGTYSRHWQTVFSPCFWLPLVFGKIRIWCRYRPLQEKNLFFRDARARKTMRKIVCQYLVALLINLYQNLPVNIKPTSLL